MRHTMLVTALIVCPIAAAQVLTLADVKAKNAAQLTADDLKQQMPGAKVVSMTVAGSTRSWQNMADGTFTATSDNRGTGGRARPSSGNGKWRLTDNGRYCVAIQWNTSSEEWCRYIFKAGDKYYGVGNVEDTAVASEFEFSR